MSMSASALGSLINVKFLTLPLVAAGTHLAAVHAARWRLGSHAISYGAGFPVRAPACRRWRRAPGHTELPGQLPPSGQHAAGVAAGRAVAAVTGAAVAGAAAVAVATAAAAAAAAAIAAAVPGAAAAASTAAASG